MKHVLLDILLDMKASGGELGWLTSPNEEGVSKPRLIEKLVLSMRDTTSRVVYIKYNL